MKNDDVLESGSWRLVFTRRADRYGHQVLLLAPGRVEPLMESLEGAQNDPWPSSPALKELHIDTHRAGGPIALLVGMAGRSHWSLSIELDAAADLVFFDVACRAHEPVHGLGSSYRPLASAAVSRAGDGRNRLLGSAGQAMLEVNDGGLVADESRERFSVVPSPPGPSWPQTIRWRYTLQLWRGTD